MRPDIRLASTGVGSKQAGRRRSRTNQEMPTLHGCPKRPHPAVRNHLDVFHAEPLRSDHPLAAMDNVTLTTHASFRTLEASMTLLRRAIDIASGIVLAGRGSG